ncbi:isochorismatase family cysteine hydrolase [Ancylomarina longa]|uniref:Cysteine hydrolase n=1 Tax=Ancylomarina longa TaxID=2487017 RepID=A0A434AVL5_9BACT|nr:isochorismatase family cysteine hydrolase [Ancylomarina longa]RUT78521.1 cysteine hydrolase [Ancylomarina longa]
MFAKNILFWNVDTQKDFINPNGKLYAPGAEEIQNVLLKITRTAKNHNIQVVNTADHHYSNSPELSATPDFITTFPEHCMANTPGASYVTATQPTEDIFEVLWNKTYSNKELENCIRHRNIIIRKDAFDVFEGNANTDPILKKISPQKIFIYGVTTNVCVNYAAIGLAKRNIEVFVIEDAIKELPNIPLPFKEWSNLGIQRISYSDLEKYCF